MKYDHIYPDAHEDFISESFDDLPPVINVGICTDKECKDSHACEVCKTPTTWGNGTATVRVCSQECNKAVWDRLIMTVCAGQLVRGP